MIRAQFRFEWPGKEDDKPERIAGESEEVSQSAEQGSFWAIQVASFLANHARNLLLVS